MNKLNASRLAVLEGKWYPSQKSRRNTSIRELFDFLCNIKFSDSQSYHYEMFNDEHAFHEIVQRLKKQNGIHCIYVAAHGSEQGIHGANGDCISLQKIDEAISSSDIDRGRFHGIYFGSCLFGQHSTLEQLLYGNKKITWVAGYGKEIDFIKSSALDLIFWHHYLMQEGTPLSRIKNTSNWLNSAVSGLINDLDFRVYCWDERTNDYTVKLVGK
jgi:hypothetical protein